MLRDIRNEKNLIIIKDLQIGCLRGGIETWTVNFYKLEMAPCLKRSTLLNQPYIKVKGIRMENKSPNGQ